MPIDPKKRERLAKILYTAALIYSAVVSVLFAILIWSIAVACMKQERDVERRQTTYPRSQSYECEHTDCDVKKPLPKSRNF